MNTIVGRRVNLSERLPPGSEYSFKESESRIIEWNVFFVIDCVKVPPWCA